MSSFKQTYKYYILYALSCLVIITASITFVLSLYRLQRDSSLLNRERKRDYVTNKINKSFPTIAIIISIIVCLSSIFCFIAVLMDGRTEMLITSIVANIILGIGLIVLGVIMLGFVQNIVDNFPVDVERLLVDFIVHKKASAREELLKIENSNDCCTTQDPVWVKEYSKAAECNRDVRHRLIYADQDEQRGCVKIVTQTVLAFMPVLISEIICGCFCLLLGLWTIFIICHIHDRYNNLHTEDEITKVPTAGPLINHPYYQIGTTRQNLVPEMKTNNEYINKLVDNNRTINRFSYPVIPLK